MEPYNFPLQIAYEHSIYTLYTLTFLWSAVYVESWQDMDPVEYFILSCYVVRLVYSQFPVWL